MELISSYKIFDPTNIKCQNGQVLPPAQVFEWSGFNFKDCLLLFILQNKRGGE
jgi:hypothetical protein